MLATIGLKLKLNDSYMICINTFTLGLVVTEGPPGLALLAHVSVMLGATTAGLGRAVRTLAHVRCKRICEELCEPTQTVTRTRSQRLRWSSKQVTNMLYTPSKLR